MEYNIKMEFRLQPTEANADDLVTALEQFHPASGPADNDPTRLDVWVTVPANNARQAVDLGLALASQATNAELTAFEVLTTDAFDRRNGLTPVPELISTEDAAEMLGVSRQAIDKQIKSGKLTGHRVGERMVVLARADVEREASLRSRKMNLSDLAAQADAAAFEAAGYQDIDLMSDDRG